MRLELIEVMLMADQHIERLITAADRVVLDDADEVDDHHVADSEMLILDVDFVEVFVCGLVHVVDDVDECRG